MSIYTENVIFNEVEIYSAADRKCQQSIQSSTVSHSSIPRDDNFSSRIIARSHMTFQAESVKSYEFNSNSMT